MRDCASHRASVHQWLERARAIHFAVAGTVSSATDMSKRSRSAATVLICSISDPADRRIELGRVEVWRSRVVAVGRTYPLPFLESGVRICVDGTDSIRVVECVGQKATRGKRVGSQPAARRPCKPQSTAISTSANTAKVPSSGPRPQPPSSPSLQDWNASQSTSSLLKDL
jgi:hypothetical protein